MFARIGLLGILPEVLGTVLVPAPVLEECLREQSRADAQAIARAVRERTLIRRAVRKSNLYKLLLQDLGEGEVAAITLAKALRRPALIDEREARRVAARLGVALIGTGGLLIRAKRLGLVREVRPVLEAMRSSGYRLSEGLVARILRLAGEPIHS